MNTNTDEELVERVARVIAIVEAGHDSNWQTYRADAKQAISAVRAHDREKGEAPVGEVVPCLEPQNGYVTLMLADAVMSIPVGTKLYAAAPPQPDASREAFDWWVANNMPAGTVISEPAWWAERLWKASRAGSGK